MNILILSWRDIKHPLGGGAEKATYEHAKFWVEAGHSVTLFSSHFKGAKRKETVDGIKIRRFGSQYVGVQLAAFLWYFFRKGKKFDVVVDQFHGIPFFTPFYARTKILAYIHEVAIEVWGLNPWPSPFNLIPAAFGPALEPLVFKLFYKRTPFLTVSDSTRLDLIKFGVPEKNITIIHNGVDLTFEDKKEMKKEGIRTALFLGAVTKDKGIDDALCAFSEIKKRDEGRWKFWVVGKASQKMRRHMEKLSEKLSINEDLKIWGHVNENKKFELLRRSHVLINTSYHEGWGLVNIEANLVGTPPIGYEVRGVKDSIKNGETGLLVKKGDYKKLASSVLSLVSNKKLYSRIQRQGWKWASQFSWERSSRRSLELIESI